MLRFLLILSFLVFLGACQKVTFDSANAEPPSDSPEYSVEPWIVGAQPPAMDKAPDM